MILFAILFRMRLNLAGFALACLAVLLLAAPAGAQDDAIVDPDSPTGSEYDIPLERARRDASTDDSGAAQGYRSRTAPLFGEGIEPTSTGEGIEPVAGSRSSSVERRSTAAGKRGERSRPRDRRNSAPAQERFPRSVQAAIQQPGAPDGGLAQLLALAGALVVGLAVVGGLVLRRSRR